MSSPSGGRAEHGLWGMKVCFSAQMQLLKEGQILEGLEFRSAFSLFLTNDPPVLGWVKKGTEDKASLFPHGFYTNL